MMCKKRSCSTNLQPAISWFSWIRSQAPCHWASRPFVMCYLLILHNNVASENPSPTLRSTGAWLVQAGGSNCVVYPTPSRRFGLSSFLVLRTHFFFVVLAAVGYVIWCWISKAHTANDSLYLNIICHMLWKRPVDILLICGGANVLGAPFYQLQSLIFHIYWKQ